MSFLIDALGGWLGQAVAALVGIGAVFFVGHSAGKKSAENKVLKKNAKDTSTVIQEQRDAKTATDDELDKEFDKWVK